MTFDRTDTDPIGNLTEGAATADTFDFVVTPALANDMTISFRLQAQTSEPPNALDPADVILHRTSDNALMTCSVPSAASGTQILDCTLIALGDAAVDVAAAPTGTSSHGFSIAAAADEIDGDSIDVLANIRPFAGYGTPPGNADPALDPNSDAFQINDPVDLEGPIGVSAEVTQLSQVLGYHVTVAYALTRPITAEDVAAGGGLTITVTPGALANDQLNNSFRRVPPLGGRPFRDNPRPRRNRFQMPARRESLHIYTWPRTCRR